MKAPPMKFATALRNTETSRITMHAPLDVRSLLESNPTMEVAPDECTVDMVCGIDARLAVPVREAEKLVFLGWVVR